MCQLSARNCQALSSVRLEESKVVFKNFFVKNNQLLIKFSIQIVFYKLKMVDDLRKYLNHLLEK